MTFGRESGGNRDRYIEICKVDENAAVTGDDTLDAEGEHLPTGAFVPAHDRPGTCGVCDVLTTRFTYICDDCAEQHSSGIDR